MMKDDQIIEMAHGAGITFVTKQGLASATEEWLIAFARCIAEKQKEIDAGIAELEADDAKYNGVEGACLRIAAAIRKGGEK